jgi:mannose-1-phosphate guanylyltransferase/mannose-6-phosphate isomerase
MSNFTVILAGGSGTRLWPLSRKNFPKQFLELYGDRSLLQHTFLRMADLSSPEKVYVVTNQDHFYNVLNQVRELSPGFPEDHIIVEPEGRNTFPAIVLALRYLSERANMRANDAVIFTPADAYVADEAPYKSALTQAGLHAARGLIVVGITPDKADTGYGYIEKGEIEGGILRVKSFREKPDAKRAEEYLASGNYLWNSGLYIGTLDSFLYEIAKQTPEVLALYNSGLEMLTLEFASMPHLSVDHALTERSENVFVIPGTFGWSDVGSFDALAEVLDQRGVNYPKYVGVDSERVFVHSESKRLVVTIGIKDLVIVDHHDSLLIHEKGRSGEVGAILKTLQAAGHKEVEHNLFVHRPWGRYEVLIDTPNYKVKKIVVYPGAKLSLQSHEHRAEHWVVVHGVAEALVGDKVQRLNANESAYIPSGNRHRLSNPGTVNLEIIEVQTGTYLGEDDIKRYEDTYKRK